MSFARGSFQITCAGLVKAASDASDGKGRKAFDDMIYDHFSAETTSNLESEALRQIFLVLAPYVEDQRLIPNAKERLVFRRLKDLLQASCTPEAAIVALEFDEIQKLYAKWKTGVMSEHVLFRKLRRLTPVAIDQEEVLELLNKYRHELERTVDKD